MYHIIFVNILHLGELFFMSDTTNENSKNIFFSILKILFNIAIICTCIYSLIYTFFGYKYNLKSIPSRNEAVINLTADEYNIATYEDVTELELVYIMSKIIYSCKEDDMAKLIDKAFYDQYNLAFALDDSIENIVLAYKPRIKDKKTSNSNSSQIVSGYFETGIVLFYFTDEHSAGYFYNCVKQLFEAIKNYYDKTIYNLYDEELFFNQKNNIVYLSTKTALESVRN